MDWITHLKDVFLTPASQLANSPVAAQLSKVENPPRNSPAGIVKRITAGEQVSLNHKGVLADFISRYGHNHV